MSQTNPLTDFRYFAVAHDPESYETLETTDIVDGWKRLMFFTPEDAPAEEVEQFKKYSENPNNWMDDPEGNVSVLVWNVIGESNGTITFYRITHDSTPTLASVRDELARRWPDAYIKVGHTTGTFQGAASDEFRLRLFNRADCLHIDIIAPTFAECMERLNQEFPETKSQP